MEFEMVPRGEIEVKGKGENANLLVGELVVGRVMLIATRHTMNIFAMPEYCWYAIVKFIFETKKFLYFISILYMNI